MSFKDKIKTLEKDGIFIEKGKDAKKITGFKSGGIISYIAYPKTEEQLAIINDFSLKMTGECKITGNLSNTLISDRGYDGILINTKKMDSVEVYGDKILAQAGASLRKISDTALKFGLTGFEFASNIPGTLGGAVCMNAGAFGSEMKDIIQSVTVLDYNGKIFKVTPNDLNMQYRHSLVEKNKYTVLSAVIILKEDSISEIKKRLFELINRRYSTQPKMPSLGSVFKKINDKSAGYYIDKSGLKGYSIGKASVSSVHANFIVNTGGATTSDYLSLTAFLQEKLFKDYGLFFEKEVKYIE